MNRTGLEELNQCQSGKIRNFIIGKNVAKLLTEIEGFELVNDNIYGFYKGIPMILSEMVDDNYLYAMYQQDINEVMPESVTVPVHKVYLGETEKLPEKAYDGTVFSLHGKYYVYVNGKWEDYVPMEDENIVDRFGMLCVKGD